MFSVEIPAGTTQIADSEFRQSSFESISIPEGGNVMSDHFTGFNCCVQERLNRQYDEAVRLSESEAVRELPKACERFEALGDFRDSEEKLRLCRGKLRECLQAFEGKIAAGYGHTVGLRADGSLVLPKSSETFILILPTRFSPFNLSENLVWQKRRQSPLETNEKP